MRTGLFLGLAVLVLALAWLARPSARGQGRHSGARQSAAERTEPTERAELLAPDGPDAAVSDAGGEDRSSTRARSSASRALGRAAVAPVRGRVVVAETGDPIETVLDLRLRTNDLLRSEDLRTRPDGSFEGHTLFPRSVLLALVKDEEGRELVDQEAPFDPGAEEEWRVRVPESAWPTFVRGTVVDRRGTPLGGATLRLVPLDLGGPLAEGASSEDGSFLVEDLRAGRYQLLARGNWSAAPPLEVLLRAGPNELGVLVVDEPAAGGDLVVRITSDAPGTPVCAFELREAGGLRQAFDTSLGHVLQDGRLQLMVAGLPAGRYTLEAHALDGRHYEPARLAFEPPAELALAARGAGLPGTTFRARAAAGGQALTGFTVFGRRGRTWRTHQATRTERLGGGSRATTVPAAEVRVPPGYDSWVVYKLGYQVALGDFDGAGETLEVALASGWSELYQFEDASRDPGAPPDLLRFHEPPVLAGVAVLVDGTLAGTSDHDGFLAFSAASEPQRVEFQLPGWFVAREEKLVLLRTVEMAQSP